MDRSAHAFDDELARLDAVATAEAIAARELRADEVITAAVERARRLEPQIRAIATGDYDRAIATAGVAPTVPGPFGGVPTFIKDMTDVAGLPTRNGSDAFATAPPAAKTGGIAEQLFAMGTIGLGKSRLPEFGFIPSTEFPHAEPTRNPWNLDHTAGGSSGGAAALVAAGVVPIAHGQDGGGSIRVPAGSCGLVGLKPTRGRLLPDPHGRLLPVDLVVDGVLTRSVRDTARYFTEAEARHRNPKLLPMGDVSSPLDAPLRIGVVTESPSGAEVDAATRRELDRAVTLVESLGHHVEPLSLPVSPQFPEDFVHYWSMLAWSVEVGGRQLFGPSFDRSKLTDLTRGLADRFRSHRTQTPGAIVRLRRSTAEHLAVFGSVDVIMSPTVTHLSPPIGHLGMDLPFDELFPRVEEWVGFTPLANATGAPSISLPLGHDAATNLPVGIMFGAANGHDGLLLRLALQLEAADPWPHLS